jgi:glycolate oxidase FAD binding subunit
VEAMAAVMGWCSSRGVAVRPGGIRAWGRDGEGGDRWEAARQGSAAGGDASGEAVVVSTARLAGVTEYDPADLVVGVRAGTSLADLGAILGEQGQELPLDPAARGASMGATLAANAAGPLQAGHGTMRDLALGVEMVTGDGRVVRFGGRVVKNVAGYDMVRLVTGSCGVLGIITSLHTRVYALPEADVTLQVEVGGPERGAALALAVRDRVRAASLEVVSPGGGAGWRLLVRLRGGRAGVEEARERVLAEAGSGVEAAADCWDLLAAGESAAAVRVVTRGRPGELGARVAAGVRFCREACGSAVAAVGGAGPDAGGWRVLAHATTGTVRLLLGELPAGEGSRRLVAAADSLAAECANASWTFTYHRIPEAARAGLPPRTAPAGAAASVMEGIRRAFDPAGILRPGGSHATP